MAVIYKVPLSNNSQYTLDTQYTAGGTSLVLNTNVASVVQAPGTCVVDRVDVSGNKTASKRTYYTFTGVSTTTLTGLAVADGTDQVHAVGAIVEFMPDITWAQSIYNGLTAVVDAATQLLDTTKVVDLTTAQTLSKKTLKSGIHEVITTGGGTTVYTLTPSVAIASYATGQEFTILMNATNTGASTINISGLGAKSLTKGGATALSSGDLLINAEYKIIYDGTQFQVIGISGSGATIATAAEVTTGTDNAKMVTPLAAQALGGANGWISTGTFTYATADSPTFTITVASGAASIYGVGDRIKLTQSTGGTKYFIITVVADTVLTVYGGTDYTLNNEAITAPFYSHKKSPLGFPTSPAKWTVTTTDTSDRNQATPTQNTWYNLGSISISGPIGVWKVRWFGNASFNRTAAGDIDQYGTLSTANNTESDTGFTTRMYLNNATGASIGLSRAKLLTLASKTAYYLNAKNASGSSTQINWLGSAVGPTTIEFESAYL